MNTLISGGAWPDDETSGAWPSTDQCTVNTFPEVIKAVQAGALTSVTIVVVTRVATNQVLTPKVVSMVADLGRGGWGWHGDGDGC
mgnify:CR=1 FL=1